MTRDDRLKIARKWAREKGGILRRQHAKINGMAAYWVEGKNGETICDNWTLYSIACDAIYA